MTESIKIVRKFAVPPEQLWHALTEAHHLAAWHSDEASGSLDAGSFVLGWPSLGAQRELFVREVREQKRLVLESGPATVTFELSEGEIHLHHQGLNSKEEVEGTRSSWQVALAVLEHYLKYHFGKSRMVHWAAAPACFTAEQTYAFFSHGVALGAWLGQCSSSLETVGQPLELQLAGERLALRVLASNPGRDVALGGMHKGHQVLIMRTLPAPLTAERRIVALIWSQWGKAPIGEPISEALDRAVERLAQLAARAGSA
jgi:uncharacterized protein YndB with AHSA1/START domain